MQFDPVLAGRVAVAIATEVATANIVAADDTAALDMMMPVVEDLGGAAAAVPWVLMDFCSGYSHSSDLVHSHCRESCCSSGKLVVVGQKTGWRPFDS